MGKEIFKETREFLEYIIEAGRDEQKTSWEFLKKKYGKKKYERIYDFCVHRGYFSSLPYRKGKKRDNYIYVKDNGFAFLEERGRMKLQQNQIDSQNFLTFGILSFAIFSGIITLIYYYFNLKYTAKHGSIQILIAGFALLLIIAFLIKKLWPKK